MSKNQFGWLPKPTLPKFSPFTTAWATVSIEAEFSNRCQFFSCPFSLCSANFPITFLTLVVSKTFLYYGTEGAIIVFLLIPLLIFPKSQAGRCFYPNFLYNGSFHRNFKAILSIHSFQAYIGKSSSLQNFLYLSFISENP